MIQDMFEAIERGDYPVWNVYVQLMSPEEAERYETNIFDMTKVWSQKDFPLQQIGRLTMNRNVSLRNRSPILSCSVSARTAAKLFRRH
jgi:catalase